MKRFLIISSICLQLCTVYAAQQNNQMSDEAQKITSQEQTQTSLNDLMWEAIEADDIAMLQSLFSQEKKPDVLDIRNRTSPLKAAFAKKNIKMMELLLQQGAHSEPLLSWLINASGVDHFGVLKLLITYDKNINAKVKGMPVLLRLLKYNPLLSRKTGTIEKYVSLVSQILDRGAQVNIRDENKKTALSHAIDLKNYTIVKLLLDKGAYVNAVNSWGRTPLMEAVGDLQWNRPWKDVIELFFIQGANINHQDKYGSTALIEAVKIGDQDAVQALLAFGADEQIRDKANKTAFDYPKAYNEGMQAAREAGKKELNAKMQEIKSMEEVLESEGLSDPARIVAEYLHGPKIKNVKTTAQKRKVTASKVNLQKKTRMSPEAEAEQTRINEQIFNLFRNLENSNIDIEDIKDGLKAGFDIEVRDENDNTPLMLAIRAGRDDVVQLLLEHVQILNYPQQHLHIQNSDGNTALDLARRQNREDIVERLEKILIA